jgi:hypothetical protein
VSNPIRSLVYEFVETIVKCQSKHFKIVGENTVSDYHIIYAAIPSLDIEILAKKPSIDHKRQTDEYSIYHPEYNFRYKKVWTKWDLRSNPNGLKFRLFCTWTGNIELVKQHTLFLKLLNS